MKSNGEFVGVSIARYNLLCRTGQSRHSCLHIGMVPPRKPCQERNKLARCGSDGQSKDRSIEPVEMAQGHLRMPGITLLDLHQWVATRKEKMQDTSRK